MSLILIGCGHSCIIDLCKCGRLHALFINRNVGFLQNL